MFLAYVVLLLCCDVALCSFRQETWKRPNRCFGKWWRGGTRTTWKNCTKVWNSWTTTRAGCAAEIWKETRSLGLATVSVVTVEEGCFLAAIVTTNALFKNNALFNTEYIEQPLCSQTKTKNQIPFVHTRTPKHRIQLFQKNDHRITSHRLLLLPQTNTNHL